MNTFSTSMNFATNYYFTLTLANGTYDTTNNCTNGTTARSDETGTMAVFGSAYPCYAYSIVCVCY